MAEPERRRSDRPAHRPARRCGVRSWLSGTPVPTRSWGAPNSSAPLHSPGPRHWRRPCSSGPERTLDSRYPLPADSPRPACLRRIGSCWTGRRGCGPLLRFGRGHRGPAAALRARGQRHGARTGGAGLSPPRHRGCTRHCRCFAYTGRGRVAVPAVTDRLGAKVPAVYRGWQRAAAHPGHGRCRTGRRRGAGAAAARSRRQHAVPPGRTCTGRNRRPLVPRAPLAPAATHAGRVGHRRCHLRSTLRGARSDGLPIPLPGIPRWQN